MAPVWSAPPARQPHLSMLIGVAAAWMALHAGFVWLARCGLALEEERRAATAATAADSPATIAGLALLVSV